MADELEKSPALKLFLIQFLQGREPKSFNFIWEEALGESPSKSVARLEKLGLIEKAGITNTLTAILKVNDLKRLLKESGQPQSGNKPELVDRFIKSNLQKATVLAKNAQVYICTAQGQALAQKYKDGQIAEKKALDQLLIRLLSAKSYEEASHKVAQYEARQVFPRGLGTDWNHVNHRKFATALQTIFTKTPKLLTGLETSIQPLRITAAMTYLWGTNEYSPAWLPAGYSVTFRLGPQVISRMLMFHAMSQETLQEFRSSGVVKKVRILSAEDNRTCSSCKAISGKTYSLNQVPELPHENCTSLDGCRCTYLPVV